MPKLKTMLFVRKEIGIFCIYETSIYEICICLLFCCALDTRFCYNNFCCCRISSFLISTHTRDFLFLGPILQCVYFVWVQSASVLRLRNPSGLFNSLFFVDVSTEDFIEHIKDGNYVVAFLFSLLNV